MYRRSLPLGGLLVIALSSIVATDSSPAAAKRAAPDIRGTYFGVLRNNRGDLRQADLTIASQNARWVGGRLNLTEAPQGTGFLGVLSGSRRVRLIAKTARGQRPVRLKLRGRYEADPQLSRLTITGTYVMTGAVRERGTFELSGNRNHSDE